VLLHKNVKEGFFVVIIWSCTCSCTVWVGLVLDFGVEYLQTFFVETGKSLEVLSVEGGMSGGGGGS
jgi:hypothetical protein